MWVLQLPAEALHRVGGVARVLGDVLCEAAQAGAQNGGQVGVDHIISRDYCVYGISDSFFRLRIHAKSPPAGVLVSLNTLQSLLRRFLALAKGKGNALADRNPVMPQGVEHSAVVA